MTRINLVDPVELSNQHLIAEYREIFMVGSALQRSIKSRNWENVRSNLPSTFTLNTGHVKFFYNKGRYLHKRYKLLVKEMKRREMRPDPDRQFKKDQFPRGFYKDWSPGPKDIEAIRQRIQEKINQKPDWYKWYE